MKGMFVSTSESESLEGSPFYNYEEEKKEEIPIESLFIRHSRNSVKLPFYNKKRWEKIIQILEKNDISEFKQLQVFIFISHFRMR
jgi:hypothetical protein